MFIDRTKFPHFVVYKTTCTITREYYIGKYTLHEKERRFYLGSGDRLRYLIKKHGRSNFVRELLYYGVDEAAAYEAEKLIVEEVLSDSLCVNIAHGGEGAMSGRTHTPEVREMLRKLNTGRKWTETQRENYMKAWEGRPNPMQGKPMSPEHKEKLRQINLGKKASAETRAKLSAAHKGRKHTEEAKEKIRQAKLGERNYNYGKKVPPQTRAALLASTLGVKRSEETREKMSEYAKNRTFINNGEVIKHHDIRLPIPDGWVKGKTLRK